MELLPFQKEAVDKMVEILRLRGGVYNACEMGLGKSAMALSAINKMPEIQSVFIICPAIVRLVWAAEINRWSPPDPNRPSFTEKFTIASYNQATSDTKNIVKLSHIDCLILDEAHYVKSSKAARTKAVLGSIWPKAKYKICLSGTPFTRSVIDCWTLFSRLAPEEFPDWWNFANYYTKVSHTPWGIKYEGIKNAEDLKRKIRSTFFIRYKKDEVLQDLPEKQWIKIPLPEEYKVEMTNEEKRQSQHYVELLKESYIKKIPIREAPPVAVATILRRQGLKKVKAIVDFSKNLLDQELPVVIFAYHKDVIAELRSELYKYDPVTIDGSTTRRGREESVNRFQNKETLLFIGNIVAAGIGITLSRGNNILFAELSWNPSEVDQAAARCHRIGTKGSVNCYYFPVSGSIDERVIDNIMDKVRTFNKVIG